MHGHEIFGPLQEFNPAAHVESHAVNCILNKMVQVYHHANLQVMNLRYLCWQQ